MKKILAIAVAAFAFAACGGGNGGSTSSNVEPLKDGVSFETDTYSVMVPTGMEEKQYFCASLSHFGSVGRATHS